jgi:hypothetical protein
VRLTGQQFAKAKSYPDQPATSLPREHWFVTGDAKGYGVLFDAHGKIA